MSCVFHRVDEKLIVKVSDSALSRDLFPDDYHWVAEAESRPVKWMPPEAIVQPRSSAAADMVIRIIFSFILLIDWRSNPKAKSVNLSFYSQVCKYLYFVKCVILHLLNKRLHTLNLYSGHLEFYFGSWQHWRNNHTRKSIMRIFFHF